MEKNPNFKALKHYYLCFWNFLNSQVYRPCCGFWDTVTDDTPSRSILLGKMPFHRAMQFGRDLQFLQKVLCIFYRIKKMHKFFILFYPLCSDCLSFFFFHRSPKGFLDAFWTWLLEIIGGKKNKKFAEKNLFIWIEIFLQQFILGKMTLKCPFVIVM